MRCYKNLLAWLYASVFGMVFAVSPCPAVESPLKAGSPDFDRSVVYRYDPVHETFSPIERSKIKPLHVYYRFSSVLDDWVWSKADGRGQNLEFAMGAGSIQRVYLFDLTINIDEGIEILEQRVPAIARRYLVEGSRASMLLGEDGKWELNGIVAVGHVYDRASNQRWEWHGDHRVAVVHGGGRFWQDEQGSFVPLWGVCPRAHGCP